MRVLVLGASGLLGRSIGDELLSRHHDVVAVSRSGTASTTMLAQASVVRTDLTTAGDAELDALHDEVDAVVHCLGPDDRDTLATPVSATFDRLLVGTTVRAAHAARRAGVTAFVVLGSYFSTFDRLHPHWGLAARHPYIAARGEQAAQAIRAAGDDVVSVLEIPFVFGAVPGVQSMWKNVFFDRLRRGPVGVTLPGGSAAVRHTDVARAAALLVEGSAPAGRYPLAVDNISYRQLSDIVLAELGRRVPVVSLPAPAVTAGLLAADLAHRARGRGTGLDPRHLARDILGRCLYLDPAHHSAPLGLVPGSVDEAIRQSVRAAYPTHVSRD